MEEDLGVELDAILSQRRIQCSAREFLAGLRSRANNGEWGSLEGVVMSVTNLKRHEVRPIMGFLREHKLVIHNGKSATASRWQPLPAFDDLEQSLVPPPGAAERLRSLAEGNASRATELITQSGVLRDAATLVEALGGDIERARAAAKALLDADV